MTPAELTYRDHAGNRHRLTPGDHDDHAVIARRPASGDDPGATTAETVRSLKRADWMAARAIAAGFTVELVRLYETGPA